MTDITIADSDIVEQHEQILIHVFYNLLNYDYRMGLFTDESSIYDMGSTGLSDEDYISVANQYYEQANDSLSYSEGQKLYFKLLNKVFDKMIADKFKKTYGFELNPDTHLLKDIALLLKDKFPERNWELDNIFIIKTLDNDFDKREKEEQENKKQEESGNVTKLPIRKKPTPEEILNGTNEFLMNSVLGIPWAEAVELAQKNYDKKMEGKKFSPYMPEQKKKMRP